MAATTRCKTCKHKPGVRSTTNLTKSEPRVSKKKLCGCTCHDELD